MYPTDPGSVTSDYRLSRLLRLSDANPDAGTAVAATVGRYARQMEKVYVGARLRRLRGDRGFTQAALARLLEISPSYLNQIEHDTRPLTAQVLVRLTDVFGVDASFFGPQDSARALAELREMLHLSRLGQQVPLDDLQRVTGDMPEFTAAILDLYRRLRETSEAVESLTDARGRSGPVAPHEVVRDFFYRHRNYIDPLDRAAEALAAGLGARRSDVRGPIADYLSRQRGVSIVEDDDGGPPGQAARPRAETDLAGTAELHRYDEQARVLHLAPGLRSTQQAFRMATHVALTDHDELIESLLDREQWPDRQTRQLARIGLANHFAGAYVLPYTPFHRAAERLRYDVELLAERFRVSYESAAHRLSTLQREGMIGVPFIFVRVDRAGNISKRQSATGFHFSRTGGTCPLWNVYESFAAPEQVQTQFAEMPDGRRYLWVARAGTQRQGGFGRPSRTFAIGLGCEVRHADRLVYADGLDLDRAAPVPIGPGCKTCERLGCLQRAAPPVGHALEVDENRSTRVPYPSFRS